MAKIIHVDLNDELERYLANAAAGDEAGYVREVLRERMEIDQLRRSLQAGIDAGLDDLASGRYVTLNQDSAVAELNAIKAGGRALRRDGTPGA